MKKNSLWIVLGSVCVLFMGGCVQLPKEAYRDVQYERYVTYKKELQESVQAGSLTAEQAFRLDQEAYNQYVENQNRRDTQRLIATTTDAITDTINDYQRAKTNREFFSQGRDL